MISGMLQKVGRDRPHQMWRPIDGMDIIDALEGLEKKETLTDVSLPRIHKEGTKGNLGPIKIKIDKDRVARAIVENPHMTFKAISKMLGHSDGVIRRVAHSKKLRVTMAEVNRKKKQAVICLLELGLTAHQIHVETTFAYSFVNKVMRDWLQEVGV